MFVVEIGRGDLSFLMECIECQLPSQEAGRATVPTKIGDGQIDGLTEEIFTKIGSVVSVIMENVKKGICNPDNVPEECELELNCVITTTGKFLVLSGGGEMGIKLRLKWKK